MRHNEAYARIQEKLRTEKCLRCLAEALYGQGLFGQGPPEVADTDARAETNDVGGEQETTNSDDLLGQRLMIGEMMTTLENAKLENAKNRSEGKVLLS